MVLCLNSVSYIKINSQKTLPYSQDKFENTMRSINLIDGIIKYILFGEIYVFC